MGSRICIFEQNLAWHTEFNKMDKIPTEYNDLALKISAYLFTPCAHFHLYLVIEVNHHHSGTSYNTSFFCDTKATFIPANFIFIADKSPTNLHTFAITVAYFNAANSKQNLCRIGENGAQI